LDQLCQRARIESKEAQGPDQDCSGETLIAGVYDARILAQWATVVRHDADVVDIVVPEWH